VLLQPPPAAGDVEAAIEHQVALFTVAGSPGFPTAPAELRRRISASVRRAYDPAGTARQLLAIVAAGDRRRELRRIRAPTLVIHGAADPLVPVAAGRDTARNIPGATLLEVDGMGHDLPDALLPRLVAAIVRHCRSSQAADN
jgi:proline iminopeptidase